MCLENEREGCREGAARSLGAKFKLRLCWGGVVWREMVSQYFIVSP